MSELSHQNTFQKTPKFEKNTSASKGAKIMALFDDGILKQMYLEYAIPCDRLVSNPKQLCDFTLDYIKRSGTCVEAAKLAHHMLNLRRRGEVNGGLSRLCRRYNGRN